MFNERSNTARTEITTHSDNRRFVAGLGTLWDLNIYRETYQANLLSGTALCQTGEEGRTILALNRCEAIRRHGSRVAERLFHQRQGQVGSKRRRELNAPHPPMCRVECHRIRVLPCGRRRRRSPTLWCSASVLAMTKGTVKRNTHGGWA